MKYNENMKFTLKEIIDATSAKVVKNKIAPPFREAEFDIMYGQGVSRIGELLDMAVQLDIIKKSGAWFSFEENRIGQGRDNAKEFLKNNADVAQKVEEQIMTNRDKLSFTRQTAKKSKGKASAEDTESETQRPATKPAEKPDGNAESSPRTSDADLDVMVD